MANNRMNKDENFGDDLDAFIEMLGYRLKQPRAHIINPKRILEVESAYKAISKIVLDISPDVKIECKADELSPADAVMWIETDEFIVQDIKAFVAGIQAANNFEIYPIRNGKIKIAIMFHGILTELQG